MSDQPTIPEIRAHLAYREQRARRIMAAGRIPSGPETRGERPSLTELRRELDRLTVEREEARKRKAERPWDTYQVILWVQAERRRQEFLEEHPYLRDPHEKGATGRDR